MSRTIEVDLGDRSYDVAVGAGTLDDLGQAVSALSPSSAVIVSDSNVAPLYAPAALLSLQRAGLAASVITFPAGEQNKNIHTMEHLYDELFALAPAVDRRTVIVALGGGVTGDIAGFLAATALRGLRFVQAPTTLLAHVDSSVGGKTGVDHPAGKNLIGAFHQPARVLIDVETLRTLGAIELQSGLSECVKHAFIRDASLLDFIEANVDVILAMDAGVMVDLVARNVAIKAAVVSADERESGQRARLNFGHTVGHAVETLVGYGNMSHGQAVALGMIAACRLAEVRGLCDQSCRQRLLELLPRLGLSTTTAGLDCDKVWELMTHDKKSAAGQVRMVLPTAIGQVELCGAQRGELNEALRAIAGTRQ